MKELKWTSKLTFPSADLAYYGLYSRMDCVAFLWDDPSKNYWEAGVLGTDIRRKFFVSEYPRNTEGMRRVMAEVEVMVRLELT